MLQTLMAIVLGTLADLLAAAFLLRFAMQWAKLSFYNPIGQFILAVTDWAVIPMRRLVPGYLGFDWSSLLLAWLCQSVFLTLLALTGGFISSLLGVTFVVSMLETLRLALHVAMAVVIVSALLSWINPHAPMAPLIHQLAYPLLKPFRRWIPAIGGVDLSPLAALLVLQVGQVILRYSSAHLLPGLL